MKTATVADLRNKFRLISSWIDHGETVQIVRRGKPFAKLSGVSAKAPKDLPAKPDIMAQLREVWGDRIFSMDEVREMRQAELESEMR